MKFKALIVDDESDSRNVLKKLLIRFCPGIEICGEADCVTVAYEKIIHHQPDVVFLDIQMPGNGGFNLLKKFSDVPFEIIFVTSYDQYAIDAIRFSALDYLLKPVEVASLQQAVERLEKALDQKSVRQKQLVNLIVQFESRELERKITVHSHDKVAFLALNEITHLKAERNYTVLFTTAKARYTSTKNLGEFEDMLESYSQFVRINKSCVINISHVVNYSKGEPCIVNLLNDYSFEISRRKKQEVLSTLKNLAGPA